MFDRVPNTPLQDVFKVIQSNMKSKWSVIFTKKRVMNNSKIVVRGFPYCNAMFTITKFLLKKYKIKLCI